MAEKNNVIESHLFSRTVDWKAPSFLVIYLYNINGNESELFKDEKPMLSTEELKELKSKALKNLHERIELRSSNNKIAGKLPWQLTPLRKMRIDSMDSSMGHGIGSKLTQNQDQQIFHYLEKLRQGLHLKQQECISNSVELSISKDNTESKPSENDSRTLTPVEI